VARARTSAGILLYRRGNDGLEVFLVHPGGPFWANKDEGAWSIPKGEFDPQTEDAADCARREFCEETGFTVEGELHALAPVRQRGGKTVYAWAVEGDLDAASMRSNVFSMEWPPKSGKHQTFPEEDRGEWFGVAQARRKILSGQIPLLDQLEELVETKVDGG
jgi:predicted NUDIX family NTP pyrophosphohydrolase